VTQSTADDFEREVAAGQRFEFGENWRRFLAVLDAERIAEAERSLREMLGVESLAGRTFLDVGCGSGLFSLAAMRLGAERVHSLDFDPSSVGCARELRRRFFPDSPRWSVEPGSALDPDHLRTLGAWDVVYSWGVLHHTGSMWRALENVMVPVRPSGTLFISIYNDQGRKSVLWRSVKAFYNRSPLGRRIVLGSFVPYWLVRGAGADLIRYGDPTHRHRAYKRGRGMSVWHDWIDWLGGYPFEVAKPEQILAFYRARGFTLERMHTVGGGVGCNEFVFTRSGVPGAGAEAGGEGPAPAGR
jgi:2-polyprenyl-3-methyl-5-hydroxy-6-metoxy-1,4-benzoquinol methylase